MTNEYGSIMNSNTSALEVPDLSIVKIEIKEESDDESYASPSFENVQIKTQQAYYDDKTAGDQIVAQKKKETKDNTVSTIVENQMIEVTIKCEPGTAEIGIKNDQDTCYDLIITKLEPIVELNVDDDKAMPNYETGEELNELKCTQCNRTFKKKNNLGAHIRYMHASTDKASQCTLCLKTFKTKRHLRCHRNSVHAEEKLVQCKHCEKTFLSNKKLNNHMLCAHPRPGLLKKCEVCHKIFKTKYNLKVHMRHKHSTEDLSVTCTVCNKVFKTDILLRRHTKWSHGTVHPCVICNRTLSSLACYRTHMKNVHNNAELKICDLCGKSFKRKDAVAKHIQYVHSNMRPLANRYLKGKIPCLNCPKKFETKKALRWHFERTHAENKDVPNDRTCHICYKEMCDLKSLKRHFEQVHPTETATCTVCMKVFKSHRNLQRHMEVTHARPEKAKDCPICQKTFKCMAHLAIHMHIVHHKDGPTACDICGKEFASKIYMEKHRKLHDVSKEVPCNICGKIYKSMLHVKKHQRNIHRNKNAKKKETSETDEDYDTPNKVLRSSTKLYSPDDIHSNEMKCDSLLPLSLVEVKIEEMSE